MLYKEVPKGQILGLPAVLPRRPQLLDLDGLPSDEILEALVLFFDALVEAARERVGQGGFMKGGDGDW